MSAHQGRGLVLSPHLDDAVMSCGEWLARHPGSTVLTVFAGAPRSGARITEWDASAGFHAGDDVVALRRAEDAAALRELGARPLWLSFRDAQYEAAPPVRDVAREIERAVRVLDPACVVLPLGLFHSDHVLVREAALLARAREGPRRWLVYADAIYRALPDLESRARADLEARGHRLLPLDAPRTGTSPRKRAAVARYASQLHALATPGRPGHADAFEPERLFELVS